MRFNCAHCGKEKERPDCHVKRVLDRGYKLYCSRVCFGLGKRVDGADERKKAYNREYSRANYGAARERHLSRFDSDPEYREGLRHYGRQYNRKKRYGEYAECFEIIQSIREECLNRMTDYEIRLNKGTHNKPLKRKHDDQRTHSNKPEIGALGYIERGQKRPDGRLPR